MRVFILILLCVAPLHRTSLSTSRTANTVAKESVVQLISSLPAESEWRKMLVLGLTGDGIHKPWMDAMARLGVKLAVYDFEFKWTNGGRKLTDWSLVEKQYFSDYDRSQPLASPTVDLALAFTLETEALARAKVGNWVEYPPQQSGIGYRSIVLANNEWLPVVQAFPFFGQYEPGTTPLLHAGKLGEVKRLAELLKKGADVNAVDPSGSTALVYAASSGNAEAVSLLLNAGARANTSAGGEALVTAAASGNSLSLELILKAGANPNYRDKEGATALSVATQRRFDRAIQLLSQAGAHE